MAKHLRHLPADAPFLILSADENLFIQVMPHGSAYRVEWRQEDDHRFTIVPLERAEELFAAFLKWDEPALTAASWKRLRWYNGPVNLATLGGAAMFAAASYLLVRWLWR